MTSIVYTKTVADIKRDMSELYEQLKNRQVDIKVAAELANITGKFLKAEQLELAREIFLNNIAKKTDVDQPLIEG